MVSRTTLVRGTGASAGKASGEVVVIKNPSEFAKMTKGKVLVCQMTFPAWLPIMAKAAAIITDAGGMLSHAAIVCREFGIPAVVSTQDATEKLKDGMVVEVDAFVGEVYG